MNSIYHTEQREQTNYELLRLILEDTAGFNLNTYREWLDSSDATWAKREMVNSYLHEAKYDTIEALFAVYDILIEKSDSAAFKNFKDYATSYASWMHGDSSMMRLDSAHLEELKTLANADEHKSGTNAARNVLNFFYDSTYFTSAYLPEQQFDKKGHDDEPNKWQTKREQSAEDIATIMLYPNPAKNLVTVQFTGLEQGAELMVTNLLGVVTHRMQILESEGKVELNTTDYTNGLYLARIVHKNSTNLKSTFVIFK
jgi:hypothetical protein